VSQLGQCQSGWFLGSSTIVVVGFGVVKEWFWGIGKLVDKIMDLLCSCHKASVFRCNPISWMMTIVTRCPQVGVSGWCPKNSALASSRRYSWLVRLFFSDWLLLLSFRQILLLENGFPKSGCFVVVYKMPSRLVEGCQLVAQDVGSVSFGGYKLQDPIENVVWQLKEWQMLVCAVSTAPRHMLSSFRGHSIHAKGSDIEPCRTRSLALNPVDRSGSSMHLATHTAIPRNFCRVVAPYPVFLTDRVVVVVIVVIVIVVVVVVTIILVIIVNSTSLGGWLRVVWIFHLVVACPVPCVL
jgi:hypothetical protein